MGERGAIMTIYVVKPGDSPWAIARRFGVSVESLSRANGLAELPGLVIGQALVVPTTEMAYRVQPGDSVYSISRKFGVSTGAIISLNKLAPPYMIMPGMVLRIPQKSKNYGYIETNAYIEPSTPEIETRQVNSVGEYLTFISPFTYKVKADGSLVPIKDETIIKESGKFNTAPLMVIANFGAETFETALASAILRNEAVQDTLIKNVLSTMNTKNYYGVNVDFERISPDDRERYNAFLRKLTAAAHAQGYVVSTALAPKTSASQEGAWYSAHDYKAHGEIGDFVIIMTYEWGWSGGPPLPVAPIPQVRAVLNYAVSVIPRKKILMGIPLYGYDWQLPYMPRGTTYAKRVSPQDAYRIAYNRGAIVKYDSTALAPYFNYYDSKGVQHIIWFEDARSAQAKLLLVNEYGLRGASYWVLGPSFPQSWELLDDMYNIVKVVK